ncbi:ankyrin repeat protein, partial [Lophiotrema nucula]
TPLIAAASKGYTEVVRLLLEKGANANFNGPSERAPLYEAVLGKHVDDAIILLKFGADPNSRDSERRTPLHIAASGGLTKVVDELLVNGANVD